MMIFSNCFLFTVICMLSITGSNCYKTNINNDLIVLGGSKNNALREAIRLVLRECKKPINQNRCDNFIQQFLFDQDLVSQKQADLQNMTLRELVNFFGINPGNWIVIILSQNPSMEQRIDDNPKAKRNCLKMMNTPGFMKDEKIKKACEENPAKMEALANKDPKDLDNFLKNF